MWQGWVLWFKYVYSLHRHFRCGLARGEKDLPWVWALLSKHYWWMQFNVQRSGLEITIFVINNISKVLETYCLWLGCILFFRSCLYKIFASVLWQENSWTLDDTEGNRRYLWQHEKGILRQQVLDLWHKLWQGLLSNLRSECNNPKRKLPSLVHHSWR